MGGGGLISSLIRGRGEAKCKGDERCGADGGVHGRSLVGRRRRGADGDLGAVEQGAELDAPEGVAVRLLSANKS